MSTKHITTTVFWAQNGQSPLVNSRVNILNQTVFAKIMPAHRLVPAHFAVRRDAGQVHDTIVKANPTRHNNDNNNDDNNDDNNNNDNNDNNDDND